METKDMEWNYTVQELRKALREAGLPETGNKHRLCLRLIGAGVRPSKLDLNELAWQLVERYKALEGQGIQPVPLKDLRQVVLKDPHFRERRDDLLAMIDKVIDQVSSYHEIAHVADLANYILGRWIPVGPNFGMEKQAEARMVGDHILIYEYKGRPISLLDRPIKVFTIEEGAKTDVCQDILTWASTNEFLMMNVYPDKRTGKVKVWL